MTNAVGHRHSLVTDPEGEQICRECGEVVPTIPTSNSDPPISNEEEQQQIPPSSEGFLIPSARRNSDYTLGGSLSSRISSLNVDAHGNSVRSIPHISRIRKADRIYANSMHNCDKSVRSAVWYLISMCERLGIGEMVKERACSLYRRAYAAGAVRGRSTKWIACACLYYASKEANLLRPASDFVLSLEEDVSLEAEKTGKKNLFASYKVLTKVLDLSLPGPISPLSELTRFSSAAGLSGTVVSKAVGLYERIKDIHPTVFSGKNPASVAVCLLYIASKYNTAGSNNNDRYQAAKAATAAMQAQSPPFMFSKNATQSGKISQVTLRKRTEEYVNILLNAGDDVPRSLLRPWSPFFASASSPSPILLTASSSSNSNGSGSSGSNGSSGLLGHYPTPHHLYRRKKAEFLESRRQPPILEGDISISTDSCLVDGEDLEESDNLTTTEISMF